MSVPATSGGLETTAGPTADGREPATSVYGTKQARASNPASGPGAGEGAVVLGPVGAAMPVRLGWPGPNAASSLACSGVSCSLGLEADSMSEPQVVPFLVRLRRSPLVPSRRELGARGDAHYSLTSGRLRRRSADARSGRTAVVPVVAKLAPAFGEERASARQP